METPLVSVCSITYNHAQYIRPCLDGVLMQKTNFPIEIIINDDCSTDGTTEIIREYAEKYPGKIFPIYHKENLYSQGKRGFFQTFVFPKARGKYIAICEGDDYWTDPEKLQKQVDFMEAHPEYSMCFHPAKEKIEGSAHQTPMDKGIEQREYTLDEILFFWIIPTCSTIIRRDVVQHIPSHKNFAMGDNVLFTTCAMHGKLWCMSDCMAVYRRHAGGWTQQKHHVKTSARHARAMLESFPQEEAQKVLKIKLAIEYHHLKDYCKRSKDKKEFFKLVYMICRDVPLSYLYVHREKTDNKVIKAILTFILKSARYKPDIKVPRN